jgi:response regulator RpfG family c-di-GMP phosphodiesterase
MKDHRLHVLLVEDNPDDADLILRELKRANGFQVLMKCVDNEDDFKRALHLQLWDVIICDFALPNFSGPRAIELVEGYGLPTRVIMVSGVISEEDAGRVLGRKSLISFIAKDNLEALGPLVRHEVRLAAQYETLLESWPRALELRDKETAGHSERVTELTVRLARLMGVSEMEVVHIRRGALLHDIGKIGVPDTILLKTGALTNEERDVMRQHPRIGYDFLFPIEYLKHSMDIPYCHHEHWDGSGYPRGLAGEEIPLSARIFSVVDNFDAIVSDRPYRPAHTQEYAMQFIEEQSGKVFDPRVVTYFLAMMARA